MPVYKDQERGTWYYVVEVGEGYDRKRKKKRGFKTKKEAAAAMAAVQDELSKGTFIEPSEELYSSFMAAWLRDKKATVKGSTLSTYTWLVERHIVPALGHLKLKDIKPRHIQDFYNEQLEKGTLAAENVQKCHTIIQESLNKALAWEQIKRNPAAVVDRPQANKQEMLYWTKEEARTFLNAAEGDNLYELFLLALATGMRQGELLGLRWQDVDFNRRSLSVVQILSHDGKTFQPGAKTASGNRAIGLDLHTIGKLQQLQERQKAQQEKDGSVFKDQGLVFCTRLGTPLSPRNVNRSFDRLIAAAGVKKIRFHDLRHTHVVQLLQARESSKRIAERLGWASVKMLDRYAHITDGMQVETADLFGAAFFGAENGAENEIIVMH